MNYGYYDLWFDEDSYEAKNPIVTLTDINGSYQLYLPDKGDYAIQAFDDFNISEKFILANYWEASELKDHEDGYDFTLINKQYTVLETS